MFNLDPAKLLVILVIALIVLGPDRLPRLARQLGAAWRELTRVRDQVTDEVRAAIPEVEVPRVRYQPGSIRQFLTSPSDRTGDVEAPLEKEETPVDMHERRADPARDAATMRRPMPGIGAVVPPDDPSMN